MTAEIAIMNKSALALAADSAVTIAHGSGYKIYNTNKLFHLCNSNPIGIMVYENADLMSIPWETIIKQYRRQLGVTTFNALEDYGANFVSYLNGNALLFPEAVQDQSAVATIAYHLRDLRDRIDKEVQQMTIKELRVSETQIKRASRAVINSWHETLKKQRTLPLDAPESRDREVAEKYSKQIEEHIDDLFQELSLSERLKKRLRSISAWLLTRDLSQLNLDQFYSGVVIAGFGELDLYPAVISYRVESVVLNQLRFIHDEQKSDRITVNRGSVLIPFAQQEMVASFMDGIDPEFYYRIVTELSKTFEIYPTEIVKRLPGLTKKRKDKLLSELKDVRDGLVKIFQQMMDGYRGKHSGPIVRALSVLPKEEMASLADALVTLTSTKRRVTLDAETVGGPIDVAVISKGDGFVWIKRKHYFEADRNPQFFTRYNH